MNRREFLNRTAAAGAGALIASNVNAEVVERKGTAGVRGQAEVAGTLPARLGTYYEAEVPDTLDLAERARMGVDYFTGNIETTERHKYEMILDGDLSANRPPAMGFAMQVLGSSQCKALEAMAFDRLMSGSQQHLNREAGVLEMMVSLLGKDGLYWVPGSPDKPGLRIPEPFVYVHGQGRMLRAMIAWYQYTGDPSWKTRIDRIIDGLDRVLVVHKDDYAYFPVYGFYEEEYLRSCYTRRGWKDMAEPTHEKFGEEGSIFNHQGHMPGALANWYMLTGNRQALRLSGELVRFLTKKKFWADFGSKYPGVIGAEHAHWNGHFHGHINTLRAILEYAIATNDVRLKAFIRDGYEWARQAGWARIGYVGDGQGAGCGRLIGLAVKMTYAGVGDYWEDVDQYIRNHGTEMQFIPEDREYLWKLSEGKPPAPPSPDVISDRVIERNIGGFPAYLTKHYLCSCCGPHGNMGLFYAWDGTLRYSDGVAQVNLLLNRGSPWMDIDSYLPYEGKVVLKNKEAREAFVRIPLWVDRTQVNCQMRKRKVSPIWFGNYLHLEHLQAGDNLTIEFPVEERTERHIIPGRIGGLPGWPGWQSNITLTCMFKGNTLVEISQPLVPGSPLYQQRVHQYKTNRAPMKKVTRFATPLVLRW